MRYLVVVEEVNGTYSAYLPDVPGYVAAGDSKEEVLSLIREGIEFHLAGLREDGEPIPTPTCSGQYLEVETL